jgi:hypothetical protein
VPAVIVPAAAVDEKHRGAADWAGYALGWGFYAHFYARYAILFCIILRLFCILVFSILNLTGIS